VNVLDEIVAGVREDVAAREAATPLADVMAAARAERWDVADDAAVADGGFRIAAVEFAEQDA
jgi:indole-3-glycerol phosphate synthase